MSAGCGPAQWFVVEIRPTPDGRVIGTVRDLDRDRPAAGDRVGCPVPFSGWIDLLRLLEPAAGAAP